MRNFAYLAGLILPSLALAACRILGFKSPAFQALAHLWVGAMIATSMLSARWWALALVAWIGLTLVEAVVFLATRVPVHAPLAAIPTIAAVSAAYVWLVVRVMRYEPDETEG